ncbi:hypothetical protein A9P82_13870 [Arachidicoccus ginsenosidimutans]|uniref:alkaline phosphatase family protein n=1 Tax=Arachidicoccus sp. BS20 TaxID=1850526 RepID=UPI0007F0E68B|nr:alkaline phosphatase family protein [Arachidicoccus sp. BS20]ANI90284.1 hypothetical protein A9P82_13870 [Arachidicoccus sp. BS20]
MKKKRRVIYYLVDGAHIDVIKKLIDKGELPNIKRITEEGTFRKATTCFPSTTGPAYLPFLTGHFPGTMNVTGIRWFDKEEFKRKRWFNKNTMRSYCGPEAGLFNTDMPQDKPTLLEIFDQSYNLYNMITRGVKAENDLGKKGKALLYMRAHFFKRNHPVDITGHARIMDLLLSGKDFDFLFAVFPSVDWDSHYYHIQDEKTIAAYKIADESIGEVRAFLEKKNLWDDTLFILTSDHGLTPTHTHLDLSDWMTEHGLKSVSYPVIWRLNPKCSVSVSGNSFASIHLLKHRGSHSLRENELMHYFTKDRRKALLQEPAIDFITYRGNRENSFVVENLHGKAIIFKDNEKYSYSPETNDPLGLGKINSIDSREALESTFDTNYPDALVQIEQLFRGKRAGDFVVSAQKGYDLRDFWEIPEHKGSHGSLQREHMLVPLISNKTLNADFSARTADVFNTILHWMGKNHYPSEGQSLFK